MAASHESARRLAASLIGRPVYSPMRGPPPMASFFFAAYHAAIFDAVNGLTYATGFQTPPANTACTASAVCYTPQGTPYALSVGQSAAFTGLNVTENFNSRLSGFRKKVIVKRVRPKNYFRFVGMGRTTFAKPGFEGLRRKSRNRPLLRHPGKPLRQSAQSGKLGEQVHKSRGD